MSIYYRGNFFLFFLAESFILTIFEAILPNFRLLGSSPEIKTEKKKERVIATDQRVFNNHDFKELKKKFSKETRRGLWQ